MLQRLKERFFDLEGEEWPRALGLALFFFLVIAVFWVLKPMKSGMFLSYFAANPVEVLGWTLSGAQAEQLARVLNMVVAYLVVVGFSIAANSCTRRLLILFFCLTFGGLFVLFAMAIDRPSEPLVWSFYVTGDIWTTTMVATFWAFANDITTAAEAERMYGV
ncbi:MAG: Npt1/Npt2 family nucleotide transporter, partial [Gemmatimonadota bacterium]